MRLCVSVVALAVLLCVQWQAQAELSRSEIQRAVRAAKVTVDSAYKYSRRESLSRVARNVASSADILRLMKQPKGLTREAVRRADYMNNALMYLQNPHFRSKRSTSNTTELSDQDMAALAEESGCAHLIAEPSCNNVPNLHKYRTPNSVCNNLEHPLWGASNIPFLRLLAAEYQDGLSLPKGWDPEVKIHGHVLPLVREVSNRILHTGNTVENDPLYSMLVTFFGQWTDHDLTLTPHSSVINSFNSTENCEDSCERSLPCFPIQVPSGDTRLPQGGCMPFIRSAPACTKGPVRRQMNALTAFLDVGQVYGSDKAQAQALRDLSSDKGLMKVNQEYSDNGRELLPFSPMNVNMCATRRRITNDSNAKEVPCFYAGDERVDENIALTTLHTLFVREHNRLARKLAQINPHWDGEKLYQEARKILGAVSQVITYRDYLPHIMGPDAMAKYLSTYPGYSSQVDPSISNMFATAAYRFAHFMIQPTIARYDEEYKEHPTYPNLLLHRAFVTPWRMVFEGGIDPVLRGIVGTPAKLNSQKNMMPDELRENLFKFTMHMALDLGSLNMQRGRDHGLPGYNAWRGYCGLSQPKTVEELGKVLRNNELAKKLMDLYKTPDNIDPWLGGLSEPLVPGGRVGPMFACLIAEQFKRIRQGDRLWWENRDVFKPRQRKSIRQASMARIICDNTGITEVPLEPFQYRPRGDGYTPCEEIPELDLSPWKENPQQPRGRKVAFSARLGNSFPKAHTPIVFHEVLYNHQGDYNEKTGRFVCRVPGVYEFHMTLNIHNAAVGVDMMLNGERLLHSYNTYSGGDIVASGSTLTRLKTGDEVYLVINEGTNSILKDSQFNGYLVFTEEEEDEDEV